MKRQMKRQTAVLGGALLTLLMLGWSLPGRFSTVARDDRGDGGGKGVIILIATVLGIAAVVAVGVLITNQINSRAPGLGQ